MYTKVATKSSGRLSARLGDFVKRLVSQVVCLPLGVLLSPSAPGAVTVSLAVLSMEQLMDGRSIYTPSYGGVNWKVQDMVMDDVERIEVIRGPGATLWGANAVNGVINITSKSSKETQGLLIFTADGTEEQPLSSIRYGGEINPTFLKCHTGPNS